MLNWLVFYLGPVQPLLGKGASSLAGNYDYEWNHSLYVPFVSYDGQNHHWHLNALINMYNYVRLTNDAPQQAGSAWSRAPLNAAHWFADVTFAIHAKNERNAGDGLAFWLVEEPLASGPEEEAFGGAATFKGLGIFVDLYANAHHEYSFPRISAMINDGTRLYANERDGEGQLLAACTPPSSLLHHNKVTMRVLYAAQRLEVLLQLEPEAAWTPCLVVQYVNLPQKAYLGVTARTGTATAQIDLLGITTAAIEAATANQFWSDPPHRAGPGLKMLLGVCLLGIVGWLGRSYWKRQQLLKNHII